VACDLVDSKEY
jgi:hypothetical protein